MNLARIGVKYPVTTAMFFIALVLIGLFSYQQLGLDLMPELEMPAITVTTFYSGAAPEEVESEITEILERSLATVADLKEIESLSRENVSTITLRFDWGTNLNEAANDIRDKIDFVKGQLPEDVEDPLILKFDLSMIPVYVLGVTAEQSLPDLYDIAEDKIIRQLETVPGVASAMIFGGDKRQVNIRLQLAELNAYGVSVGAIRQAIQDSNIALPVGRIEAGKFDYLLRVPEKIQLEEIGDILIKKDGERGVYLKDVSEIEFGHREATSVVSVNGRSGILMMVQKRSGENTVEVARRARAKLTEIEKTLPADVKIHIIRDFSDFIESTIDNLKVSLLWGGFLVAVIILLFLSNFASSLIILTALPTSLIIAFFLLYLGDYTLNIISLSSLAIALGMVVDGAIVVLDNISRKKEEGLDLIPSVLEGTGEVAKPVVASALTTIVVFFPVLFVGGIAGIFFQQMAFVIILTLLVSLLCALWLIPMLSSKSRRSLTPRLVKEKLIDHGQKFLVFLERHYESALRKVLKRPAFFLFVMGICFILALGLFRFVETRFAAEADAEFFTLEAELPLGTRLGVTGEVARALENIIEEDVPEKITSVKRWGYEESLRSPAVRREGSHIVWGAVRLSDRVGRRRSVFEIVDALRERVEEIPGARIRFSTEDPLAGMLYGAGKPLVLEIYSRRLDEVTEFAQELELLLNETPGIYDAEISRELGRPEMDILIDRKKAASLGLPVADVARTLRTLFEGEDISEFSYQGKNYDINLRLREEDRRFLEDIDRIFLPIVGAIPIKLTEIAQVQHTAGPSIIERKNQERLVRISANIRDIGIDQAAELVSEKIHQLGLPEDTRYAFGGEYQEQREVFSLMLQAAILALILVYIVMASQFESLVHPFFVLFSIPFAFVGVALMLLITNTYFTMDSFLGIIMLIGIVVNNAIVLITYMNQLKEKNPGNTLETVIQAGRRRLRPIMMTSLSTISALLPLSLQRGQGSEYWRSFSNTIIGGLSVAFVVTLFIIPAIYYLYERRK
jgi:CzcA family heavy metal efflux pump